MATQTLGQPFWVGNTLNDTSPLHRGDPARSPFVEAATQSFKQGDLIYLAAATGKLAICTVNGSNVLDSAIAGIATKNAVGTLDTKVHFHVIRPDDLFAMNVYHATPASAITALTQLGLVYGIIRISNKWHIDIENTVEGGSDSLARVKIVDFLEKNPYDGGNFSRVAIGDIYGIAVVQFLPFSIGNDGAPFQRILQLA